jgi:xanthine dehydrogenase accessory factor
MTPPRPALGILIRGAGDLATGVAHRLHRAGFSVAMVERRAPLAVRRGVAFSEAVYCGEKVVEGLRAVFLEDPSGIEAVWKAGDIPLVVDEGLDLLRRMRFDVLVEATMAKTGNTGLRRDMAPLVIALGPGFQAGRDAHFVIETKRGHDLGRVLDWGEASPHTGVPEEVRGFGRERVIRAPADGVFETPVEIGDSVEKDARIGAVSGAGVAAPISGVVRGLLRSGQAVRAGQKIGDIDPRGDRDCCFTISDKARAVAGGVLEAVLAGTVETKRHAEEGGAMDILRKASELKDAGVRAALATVIECGGSTPAVVGAKMLVSESGECFGTVGGGPSEQRVKEKCMEALATGVPQKVLLDLSGKDPGLGGQACGGRMEVFVEPVLPPPQLVIFGAGHISNALAPLARTCGFRVVVTDDREAYASTARFPEADETVVSDYRSVFGKVSVDLNSYLVILTASHESDEIVLEESLKRPCRYVGMIGSKKKVAGLFETLKGRGVTDEKLSQVHSPIGLSIGARTPQEIAVSIMGELIRVRNQGA